MQKLQKIERKLESQWHQGLVGILQTPSQNMAPLISADPTKSGSRAHPYWPKDGYIHIYKITLNLEVWQIELT